MVKLPARKKDAIESNGFIWMWFIKVYRCRIFAIYSLNLDPIADTADITFIQRKDFPQNKY